MATVSGAGEDDQQQQKTPKAPVEEIYTTSALGTLVSLNNVCLGSWAPGDDHVSVHTVKSRLIAHAKPRDGVVVVPLEEALFLCECGALVVTRDGQQLSLQSMYAAMQHRGVAIDDFVVYSHLRQLGYIVRRHTPPPTTSGALGSPPSVFKVWRPPSRGKGAADFLAVVVRPHDTVPLGNVEWTQGWGLSDDDAALPLRLCVVEGATMIFFAVDPCTDVKPPARRGVAAGASGGGRKRKAVGTMQGT